jgi:pimeloyl-ACP methyl ester carboxylesterase
MGRLRWSLSVALLACTLLFSPTEALAAACPAPLPLGPAPTRLIVVVPAAGQGPEDWASFLGALRKDPRSANLAWLVFDHGIGFTSLGNTRATALAIASCVHEKMKAGNYASVTLIGHSIGGMLARRAYLEASGAFLDSPPAPDSWSPKVDAILLFAAVNKGIPPWATWWGGPVGWCLRTFPHPRFILEDFARGSDFIADVRIAWIRYFGELYASPGRVRPRVVQFWGTKDSVVTERDNADLEAFSGPVIERVPAAKHGDLPRLDQAHAADPVGRWTLFSRHLFDSQPAREIKAHSPRRLLFIVRGIRDSSNSDWVTDLKTRAKAVYGEGNVEDVEYGYFSAAHFAFRPLRTKNIPQFRDLYAQRLAEEPLTTFDFIGHSNGTYILGQSLLSTPSMRFENVALAAPVLPTDFDWQLLFSRGQVKRVRYDTARLDWPVGILCPLLRAIGFLDVGPSGVVMFGEGRFVDSRVQKVGWHLGGHGDAIGPKNRLRLLAFAESGIDVSSGGATRPELGFMQSISRAVFYIVWMALAAILYRVIRRYRRGHRPSTRTLLVAVAALFVIYGILDVF